MQKSFQEERINTDNGTQQPGAACFTSFLLCVLSLDEADDGNPFLADWFLTFLIFFLWFPIEPKIDWLLTKNALESPFPHLQSVSGQDDASCISHINYLPGRFSVVVLGRRKPLICLGS